MKVTAENVLRSREALMRAREITVDVVDGRRRVNVVYGTPEGPIVARYYVAGDPARESLKFACEVETPHGWFTWERVSMEDEHRVFMRALFDAEFNYRETEHAAAHHYAHSRIGELIEAVNGK